MQVSPLILPQNRLMIPKNETPPTGLEPDRGSFGFYDVLLKRIVRLTLKHARYSAFVTNCLTY